MVIYKSFNNAKLIKLICDGGIGVIPTDTVYGVVCSVSDAEAVEEMYKIKGRDQDKPFIVLIPNIKSLSKFGVQISENQKQFLEKNWPAKVSVILPVADKGLEYLTRGGHSLAFRIPSDNRLLSFLQKIGPIVAPSANPQDLPTATNIDEIMDYFIGRIDFAVDGGDIQGSASTLVDFTGNVPKIIRQGDVKISF